MKLIPLIILTISLAVDVKAQKFRQEQFPFPPQFQTPNTGLFSSDSSLYLPPESHTTLPYYPMKNLNNLKFPYLPPTGTKAPSMYPSPFPFLISSSLVPNFDDDDNEEDGIIRISTAHPPMPQKQNRTEKMPPQERREMRAVPNMALHQPIDRIDVKFQSAPIRPFSSPQGSTPNPVNQTPAARRMIISTETHRNDLGFDQMKAASFQGNQYVAAPGVFISSTTEPAIPILRLSNEMDLDGSFSYEALGADQTHYVQHSHMENMGTDKEEQVVEGSYSYVGDNGQTYTVHYIADSNGFRAIGDHLPVAPPIPEIIQRSIQYNLAEEAKRPPHLKSWQDDGRGNEISDSEKNQHNFVQPPRNLFTGRTPEAFSYSYSQGSNTQNNLVTSATSQVPIKAIDITTEQPKVKPNNGPISPQITFLASQGAHLPSLNSVQNSISRMFTTEKPPSSMPQLVNYEAAMKESDQESNKALWRWQYGMNANILNQNSNKDTISRSFGEGDDVMINFSDMTPEQYTNMFRQQLETNVENMGPNQFAPNRQVHDTQNNYFNNQNVNVKKQQRNMETNQFTQNQQVHDTQNNYFHDQEVTMKNDNQVTMSTTQILQNHQAPETQNNYFNNQGVNLSNGYLDQNNMRSTSPEVNHQTQSTISSVTPTTSEDWYKIYNNNYNVQVQTTNKPVESRELMSNSKPNIITLKNFEYPAPSQTVTQSYDYEENIYEPRRIKAMNTDSTIKSNSNNANDIPVNVLHKSVTPTNVWPDEKELKETTTLEPPISTVSQLRFTDFIVRDSNNDFKPITSTTTEAPREIDTTTTENSVEDLIQTNIFLKNLFKPEKFEVKHENKINEESKQVEHVKTEAEPKTDKFPKFIQYHSKPINEIKTIKKKPLDIADILNYVSMKNHFESNKVKANSKSIGSDMFDHRNAMRFIPIQQDKAEESDKINPEPSENHLRTFNQEQQEELRGMIRNYKVLQRNNMSNKNKYDSPKEPKRELSPPPLKLSSNLPPLGRAGPSMKSYLPPIYV